MKISLYRLFCSSIFERCSLMRFSAVTRSFSFASAALISARFSLILLITDISSVQKTSPPVIFLHFKVKSLLNAISPLRKAAEACSALTTGAFFEESSTSKFLFVITAETSATSKYLAWSVLDGMKPIAIRLSHTITALKTTVSGIFINKGLNTSRSMQHARQTTNKPNGIQAFLRQCEMRNLMNSRIPFVRYSPAIQERIR